jgi:hypothetical protein
VALCQGFHRIFHLRVMAAAASLRRLDEPTTVIRPEKVEVGYGERRRDEGSHGMQALNNRHELRPGPARPGPVGLLIRVVLGAVVVYALVELVTKWDVFRDQDLIESDFWFITLFTLCLLPDVFNIGLRRRWGIWPLVVFLAGAAAIGSVGYLAAGEVWTTALAAWVYAGDLLVFAALSVSFPVAIATRTPGCEFNAIPRLTARLRGTADEETRRCLLGVDLLDKYPIRLPRRS